jgi:hypothetical protein
MTLENWGSVASIISTFISIGTLFFVRNKITRMEQKIVMNRHMFLGDIRGGDGGAGGAGGSGLIGGPGGNGGAGGGGLRG